MKNVFLVLSFLVMSSANAELITDRSTMGFIGTLESARDYALNTFELDESTDLTIWTDSYKNGGFDPIITIYDSLGYEVAQNDDNRIFITQGRWDSAIKFSDLEAGAYNMVVTVFPNFPPDHMDYLDDMPYAYIPINSYYNVNISSGNLPPAYNNPFNY